MNKTAITIFLLTLSLTLFSQDAPYVTNLMDTITKNSGLFISAHPVKKINLNLSDTALYQEYLKEEYNYKIDASLLIDLINTSRNVDTTLWQENDFTKFVVVRNPEDYISSKEVIKRFHLADKSEVKKLKHQITEYNNSHPYNRSIYYFSRPIFDKSRTFAVIAHGNGNKGLMGRDYISLFHYNGVAWVQVGVITRWIY